MERYKIIKRNATHALVRDLFTGEILIRPYDTEAMKVLQWYNKNIPANRS